MAAVPRRSWLDAIDSCRHIPLAQFGYRLSPDRGKPIGVGKKRGPAGTRHPLPGSRLRKSAGLTIGELLLILLIPVVMLFVLAFPNISSLRERRRTVCANNLTQLWKMANIYATRYGGPGKIMDTTSGGEFFLRMTKVHPPLIDSTGIEILLCPNKGGTWAGKTDYRGPAGNINDNAIFGDGDPVAMCETCGNVLYKSSRGGQVEPGSPEWQRALEATAP